MTPSTVHTDPATRTDGAAPAAVVHIGTHKTGTTSLQAWADRERAYLAEQLGLTYYRGLFECNHYELPLLCIDPGRSMSMRSKIPDWCLEAWQAEVREHARRQVLGDAPRLLISCEDFSYARAPAEVEALRDLVSPRELSVVVTLREPRAFLQSYANELSSQGFERSSLQGSFAYVEEDSWLIDYDRMLAAYRGALGAEHVHVVDYEAAVRDDGSTLPAVLTACGAPAAQLPDPEQLWLNASGGRAGPARGLLRRAHRVLRDG